jgi:hypothetical protein
MGSGRKDIAKDGEATQFKKGQTGNEKGRPPGPSFKSLIEQYLEGKVTVEDLEGKTQKVSAKAKIAILQIKDATSESLDPNARRAAASLLMDRLDGKPVQAVNLGGNEGQNLWTGITIEIVGGTKEPVQNEDELPDD